MNTELIAQLDAEIKSKQELKEIALAVEAGAEWEVDVGKWENPVHSLKYYINQGVNVRLKPKPVTRPWNKPEDVPALCWIRSLTWPDVHWLVVGVDRCGIAATQGEQISWGKLTSRQYSTDRINWFKCETTEEAK